MSDLPEYVRDQIRPAFLPRPLYRHALLLPAAVPAPARDGRTLRDRTREWDSARFAAYREAVAAVPPLNPAIARFDLFRCDESDACRLVAFDHAGQWETVAAGQWVAWYAAPRWDEYPDTGRAMDSALPDA